MKKQEMRVSVMNTWMLIYKHQLKYGFSITYREIQKELNLSSTCLVYLRIKRLKRLGIVKTKGRQIRIDKPLYGIILYIKSYFHKTKEKK